MNSKFKGIKKASWILVAALCFEQAAYADVFKPGEIQFFPKPSFTLALPESTASLEEAYLAAGGNSGLTLYLVQDAHTNESGQANIAKVLKYLAEKEHLRYIFLEAGTGDDSLSKWRSLARPDIREKVAKAFVRQGELSGAEYLDLSTDLDIRLWGVENKKLYFEAVESYKAVSRKKEFCQDYLAKVAMAAEALKTDTFNPSLREFDAKRSAYQKGELPLGDYAQALALEAEKTRHPLKYYPHLSNIAQIRQKETEIDFDAANREQQKILSQLAPEEASEFLGQERKMTRAESLSGNSHKDLHAFYSALAERTDGFREYPELKKYLEYLALAQAFSARRALDELVMLQEQIYSYYLRSPEESELHRVDEDIRLLSSLLGFVMTPSEYKTYKKRRSSRGIRAITGFLNRRIAEMDDHYERVVFHEKDFEDYLKKAEHFYELTLERDRYFLKNLKQKMDQEGQKKAALVAGGYHAVNLKELLREEGFSYVSIQPAVYHETNQKRYERILFERAGIAHHPENASGGGNDLASVIPLADESLGGANGVHARLVPALAEAAGAAKIEIPRGARLGSRKTFSSAVINLVLAITVFFGSFFSAQAHEFRFDDGKLTVIPAHWTSQTAPEDTMAGIVSDLLKAAGSDKQKKEWDVRKLTDEVMRLNPSLRKPGLIREGRAITLPQEFSDPETLERLGIRPQSAVADAKAPEESLQNEDSRSWWEIFLAALLPLGVLIGTPLLFFNFLKQQKNKRRINSIFKPRGTPPDPRERRVEEDFESRWKEKLAVSDEEFERLRSLANSQRKRLFASTPLKQRGDLAETFGFKAAVMALTFQVYESSGRDISQTEKNLRSRRSFFEVFRSFLGSYPSLWPYLDALEKNAADQSRAIQQAESTADFEQLSHDNPYTLPFAGAAKNAVEMSGLSLDEVAAAMGFVDDFIGLFGSNSDTQVSVWAILRAYKKLNKSLPKLYFLLGLIEASQFHESRSLLARQSALSSSVSTSDEKSPWDHSLLGLEMFQNPKLPDQTKTSGARLSVNDKEGPLTAEEIKMHSKRMEKNDHELAVLLDSVEKDDADIVRQIERFQNKHPKQTPKNKEIAADFSGLMEKILERVASRYEVIKKADILLEDYDTTQEYADSDVLLEQAIAYIDKTSYAAERQQEMMLILGQQFMEIWLGQLKEDEIRQAVLSANGIADLIDSLLDNTFKTDYLKHFSCYDQLYRTVGDAGIRVFLRQFLLTYFHDEPIFISKHIDALNWNSPLPLFWNFSGVRVHYRESFMKAFDSKKGQAAKKSLRNKSSQLAEWMAEGNTEGVQKTFGQNKIPGVARFELGDQRDFRAYLQIMMRNFKDYYRRILMLVFMDTANTKNASGNMDVKLKDKLNTMTAAVSHDDFENGFSLAAKGTPDFKRFSDRINSTQMLNERDIYSIAAGVSEVQTSYQTETQQTTASVTGIGARLAGFTLQDVQDFINEAIPTNSTSPETMSYRVVLAEDESLETPWKFLGTEGRGLIFRYGVNGWDRMSTGERSALIENIFLETQLGFGRKADSLKKTLIFLAKRIESEAVVGAGFVGLVQAATGVTDLGSDVSVVEIREEFVEKLSRGESPNYIPGIEPLLKDSLGKGKIRFTTDLREAIEGRDIIYLALPTPQDEMGNADTHYLEDVVRDIAVLLKPGENKIVVGKSTAPPETIDRLKRIAERTLVAGHISYWFRKGLPAPSSVPFLFSVARWMDRLLKPLTGDLGSQINFAWEPEFLREGKELEDARGGSGRIVIGADDPKVAQRLKERYEVFNPASGRRAVPIEIMGIKSAMLVKYAANGYRGSKISISNFIAWQAEKRGFNAQAVLDRIGEDPRIIAMFMAIGIGWGGSCFPKDFMAFVTMARALGVPADILLDTLAVNDLQWRNFARNIVEKLNGVKEKNIVILGGAFKPDTSDIREARSVKIIDWLVKEGANVIVVDPVAVPFLKRDPVLAKRGAAIRYFESLDDLEKVFGDADAIALVTEWADFREIDFRRIRTLHKDSLPPIFDGRNFLNGEELRGLGFDYEGVGINDESGSPEAFNRFAEEMKEFFLAYRLSFVNMLTEVADRIGANIRDVLRGLGHDPVVGPFYMVPGQGWGGYALGKAVENTELFVLKNLRAELENFATLKRGYLRILNRGKKTEPSTEAVDISVPFVDSVRAVNERQISLYLQKIREAAGGSLKGKRVAVLGLSYKGGTHATNSSRSIELIRRLVHEGALVSATDASDSAVGSAELELEGVKNLTFHLHPADAIKGSEIQVLASDSYAFRDWRSLLLRQDGAKDSAAARNLVDARHFYNLADIQAMREAGVRYFSVGVPSGARLAGNTREEEELTGRTRRLLERMARLKETLKDYTIVSRQMESGAHRGLIDAFEEEVGEIINEVKKVSGADPDADIYDLILQGDLTGGLGALMADLLESWTEIGIHNISIKPIFESFKGMPFSENIPENIRNNDPSLGDYLRDELLKIVTSSPETISLGVLDVGNDFERNAKGKARAIVGKELFVDIYPTKTKFTQALSYQIDVYYLKDGKKIHVFDEIYPDARDNEGQTLWRDVHIAVYSKASQVVTKLLQDRGVVKKNLIFVDNEVFASMPTPMFPKALHHHINHTVFRPGLYKPSGLSFQMLGLPEYMKEYVIRYSPAHPEGEINLIDLVASFADIITGVSLYEHTPVLAEDILAAYVDKLTEFRDEDIRNTNGVYIAKWEAAEKRALIDGFKAKLGFRDDFLDDRDFYEILRLETYDDLREEFKARSEFIHSLAVARLLLWLKKEQGNGFWLEATSKKWAALSSKNAEDFEDELKDFDKAIKAAVSDEAGWDDLFERFKDLNQAIMDDPVGSNVRRQVSYKGPDKFVEIMEGWYREALIEIFAKKGRNETLRFWRGLLKNTQIDGDLDREALKSLIQQTGAAPEDDWLNPFYTWGFNTLKKTIMGSDELYSLRTDIGRSKTIRDILNKMPRLLIGGRVFDEGSYARFKWIDLMARNLGLSDRIATVKNYNIRNAETIFRAMSFTVMLSDKKLEASATSPGKGEANFAALIGIWGGFMPEIFDIEDSSGGTVSVFSHQGRRVLYENVVKNLSKLIWRIRNGFLVEYSPIEKERSAEEGGEERPSAESLVEQMVKLKNVYRSEGSRRQLRYDVMASSWNVDMVHGQALAHAELWSRMAQTAKSQAEIMSDPIDDDSLVRLLSNSSIFEWRRKESISNNETILVQEGREGLFGFIESLRRLRILGREANYSVAYHAFNGAHGTQGDIFHYILEEVLRDSAGALPILGAEFDRLRKEAISADGALQRVRTNFAALRLMEEFGIKLSWEIFRHYVAAPDGATKELLRKYLNRQDVRNNLLRYLDRNTEVLASTDQRVKLYKVDLEGEERPVVVAVNAFTLERGAGITKLKASAMPVLDQDNETDEVSSMYKVERLIHQDSGEALITTTEKGGIPLTVPSDDGVEVFRIIPLSQKQIVSELSAAVNDLWIGSKDPSAVLKEKIESLTKEESGLKKLFEPVAALTAEQAAENFGEGVPSIMAFVAALAPELLEGMRAWDGQTFQKLSRLLNEEALRDVVHRGEIRFLKSSKESVIAFSRSYKGKNLIFIFHFAKREYIEDGKVWSALSDFSHAADLLPEDVAVHDHWLELDYPATHKLEDLTRSGWMVGVPVVPGVYDNNQIKQDGQRFQILELRASDRPKEGARLTASEQILEPFEVQAQRYLDHLSETRSTFTDPTAQPDAFLLLGHDDLRTYAEFVRLWTRLRDGSLDRKEIPVVISGGHGRLTTPLVQNIRAYYAKRELSGSDRDHLEGLLDIPKPIEADILRFFLTQEGLPASAIHLEGASSNTKENIVNSRAVLKDISLVSSSQPFRLQVVSFGAHVARAHRTAVWQYRNEPWEIKTEAVYKHRLAELDEASKKRVLITALGLPKTIEPEDAFINRSSETERMEEYGSKRLAANQEPDLEPFASSDSWNAASVSELRRQFGEYYLRSQGARLTVDRELVNPVGTRLRGIDTRKIFSAGNGSRTVIGQEQIRSLNKFALKLWAARKGWLAGRFIPYQISPQLDAVIKIDEERDTDGRILRIRATVDIDESDSLRLPVIEDPLRAVEKLRVGKVDGEETVSISDVWAAMKIEQMRADSYGLSTGSVDYAVSVDCSDFEGIEDDQVLEAQLDSLKAQAAAEYTSKKNVRFLLRNIPAGKRAVFDSILSAEAGFVSDFVGPVVVLNNAEKDPAILDQDQLMLSYRGFDPQQLNGWTRLFGAARGAMRVFGSSYDASKKVFLYETVTTGNLETYAQVYGANVENAGLVDAAKILKMLTGQASADELQDLAILLPVMPVPWQALIRGARLAQTAAGIAA